MRFTTASRSAAPALAILLAAAVVVPVAFPARASAAPGGELTALRTLGADEDEILLYRPEDIVFGPAGDAYVLNGGDCHVLHFDRDWNLVKSFAQQGQGPGEFERAVGFLAHDGKIWIWETGRVTRFGLDGEYLDTIPLQLQLQSPVVLGDGYVARLDASDRAACRLDADLQLVEKLGMECVTDDWMRRYQECGFVQVLTHPDWLCLLVNPFDGKLHAVGEDGAVARTVALMDQTGLSRAESPEEGTISMSFTLVMGGCCVDDRGLLWTLPMPPADEGAEDAPQTIVVRDRAFDELATFTLPEGVGGHRIVQAPDGNLILLDAVESRLHVLAYPDLPGKS